MSQHLVLATFVHEDDLLAATKAARGRGLHIIDAFTPYAVHGLDRALGLKPSRLTWVCFICGMCGFLGMLWFEHWSASISWPIDVGGKPWNSLPSDIPVAFEAAVLLAGSGSVFALFAISRLYPGKDWQYIAQRATDDRFVLVIDEADADFDAKAIEVFFRTFRVTSVTEILVGEGEPSP